MEIRTLENGSFELIYKAFSAAFADYEVQVDEKQFQTMLMRRGFCSSLSFAAFDNDEIVAFTLNGIGTFNGKPTAYDTGTGTLKNYRGQGLATKIFEYSIPYLKSDNIEQYLLEVLQLNTKAVAVYRKLGFESVREFNYFRQANEKIRSEINQTNVFCSIRNVDPEVLNSVADFWDFTPSWQNSFEAICRKPSDFVFFGAFVNQKLVGYCVFEPASGDLTQIAVDKSYRHQGIASALLYEVVKINRNGILKIINTDTICRSITDFLQAKNIGVTGQQYEMIKVL